MGVRGGGGGGGTEGLVEFAPGLGAQVGRHGKGKQNTLTNTEVFGVGNCPGQTLAANKKDLRPTTHR